MPVKLPEERFGRMHAVDQEHGARSRGADVGADRGAVPVDVAAAARAHVELAAAVAQAGEEGAAAFGAEHIAVRASGARERIFENAAELGRDGAEEAARDLADLVDVVAGLLGAAAAPAWRPSARAPWSARRVQRAWRDAAWSASPTSAPLTWRRAWAACCRPLTSGGAGSLRLGSLRLGGGLLARRRRSRRRAWPACRWTSPSSPPAARARRLRARRAWRNRARPVSGGRPS